MDLRNGVMLSLRPRKFCTICSSSTVPLFFQHFAAEFQARLRIKHAVLFKLAEKVLRDDFRP